MKPKLVMRLMPLLISAAFGSAGAAVIVTGDVFPVKSPPQFSCVGSPEQCTVTTSPLNIGFTSSQTDRANGLVAVDGGSTLDLTSGAFVGNNGGAGSTGTLTIDGLGSRANASPGMNVGFGPGDVGNVLVQNSGVLGIQGNTAIAGQDGSNGLVVVRTGGQMSVTVPAGGFGGLQIGGSLGGPSPGAATTGTLSVESAGIVTVSGGGVVMGSLDGSRSFMSIAGAGSSLTVDVPFDGSGILQGNTAQSAEIAISDGGVLRINQSAAPPCVPSGPCAPVSTAVGLTNSSKVTVTGGLFEVNASGRTGLRGLSISPLTGSGEMTVSGGGVVQVNQGGLGMGGPAPTVLTVQGAGSRVTAAGLSLGGTSVLVSDGGMLESTGSPTQTGLFIGGAMAVASGGVVQANRVDLSIGPTPGVLALLGVLGAGSRIDSASTFNIGTNGTAIAAIADGGIVNAQTSTIGSLNGSDGTLLVGAGGQLNLVTGDAPAFTRAFLNIGREQRGVLGVSDGGKVLLQSTLPPGLTQPSQFTQQFTGINMGGAGGTPSQGGSFANGDGTLNIAGAGSEVRIIGAPVSLNLGRQGTAAVTIGNGGKLVVESATDSFAVVGREAGGNGTVTVGGAGSRWQAGQQVFVGTNLTVTPGATYGSIVVNPNANPHGTGTLVASNGGVIQATQRVYLGAGGTLKGSGGTIDSTLEVAGGNVMPGTSPGTLNVTGDFILNGLLEIEVTGLLPGQFDVLHAGRTASLLGGQVLFRFLNGFTPDAGDELEFLRADGGITLGGVSFAYEGLAPPFEFRIDNSGTALRFVALTDTNGVPTPGTLPLLALGLALLALRRGAFPRR